MKLLRSTLIATAIAASALPFSAQADSGSITGPGAISATADLSFRVVIPRYIFLRVGAAAATVTRLDYNPTLAEIENSTSVLATGGDTGGGSDVTLKIFGNAGALTLTASNLANLVSGANNIPTSTLTGVVQSGSVVAPPAFGGSAAIGAAANGIVNQDGTWRFTWANPADTIYPAGTYDGTVIYTLSAP